MTIEAAIAKYKENLKKATEEIKKEFHVAIQKFFDDNPELQWFEWQQYTPYFCDGDPCTFGVYADELNIKIGEKEYEWGTYDGPEEHRKLEQSISDMIHSVPEEIMEQMFGDHIEVKFERDKQDPIVSEYCHD